MSKIINVNDLQSFGEQIKSRIPKRISDLINDAEFLSPNNISLDDSISLNDSTELIVFINDKPYKITLLQLLQYIQMYNLVGSINETNEISLDDNLDPGTYSLRYEDENSQVVENYDAITENYNV